MHPEIPDRQRRYTLFVLVLVFTSSHIDRQIMGILGQPIKESLLISDTQLGLLTGIMFAVFYATLGMPMAMWADRHNRRRAYHCPKVPSQGQTLTTTVPQGCYAR